MERQIDLFESDDSNLRRYEEYEKRMMKKWLRMAKKRELINKLKGAR